MRSYVKPMILVLGLLVLALTAAQCGVITPVATEPPAPAETQPTPTSAPVSEPTEPMVEELSGRVEIDGSSTVYPITQAVAEDFMDDHPGVQVTVGISGTGGGFKKFCAGETDISGASRPIKETEIEACKAANIEYLELQVAFDGLSVTVNPDNDFVECLSVEELNAIWMPDSTVETWQDVRPEWPAEKIILYGPDADSGTFDYFTEEINGEAGATRIDYTPSADDNVLVVGIAGNRNALGYFGYAYYVENRDKLKLVAVDNGEGCVYPNDDTIEGGTYTPLSRPLFIYVNLESLKRPEVAEFLKFYMSDDGMSLVGEVGYVRSSQSILDQQRAKLAEALK